MKTTSPKFLQLQVGDIFADRYRVVRKLGQGAVGAVYHVQDTALNDAPSALKLFSPLAANDVALPSRFKNEVLITRKLTHPRIVRTYDFGETDDGLLYLTMEFVEGFSLDHLIRKGVTRTWSFKRIVEVLEGIARGVDFAHQAGIIHRDLKSANVLIQADGAVKIADFGLARMFETDQHLTQTGESVGTPCYMAPEQVRGEDLDHRVDIYALGIIGYELVAGVVPFENNTWYNLATDILQQPLPRFVTAGGTIPKWYQSFVDKAAAKEKAARFQNMQDMLGFLEAQSLMGELDTWSVGEVQTERCPRRTDQRAGSSQRLGYSAVSAALVLGAVLAIALPNFISAGRNEAKLKARTTEHLSAVGPALPQPTMIQAALPYRIPEPQSLIREPYGRQEDHRAPFDRELEQSEPPRRMLEMLREERRRRETMERQIAELRKRSQQPQPPFRRR